MNDMPFVSTDISTRVPIKIVPVTKIVKISETKLVELDSETNDEENS